MSTLLEQLAGSARRAECAKHDAAMAHGVNHIRPIVARGNHRSAATGTELRAFFAECEADARAVVRGVKP